MMIIITSTQVFEEFIVEEFLGYITATVVRGFNFVRDASATLTSVLGGRNAAIEEQIELAFNEALDQMRCKARALKADAIINLSLEYNIEELSFCGPLLIVVAEGVAVDLVRREGATSLQQAREREEEEGLI